jgi:hypothetical protein
MEDQIAGHGELALPLSVVVCFPVPCVIEANLRPHLHGRPDPMAQHERVLGVFGIEPCALALLVVEQVAPETNEVVPR